MSYELFVPILLLTCTVFFVGILLRSRDIMHPGCVSALYIAGTLGGGALSARNYVSQMQYFTNTDRDFVIYIVGSIAILVGTLVGGSNHVWRAGQMSVRIIDRQTTWHAAVVLGSIAWVIFLFQVAAGGGFVEVYSQIKGRGDLGSGIQDFIYLSAPATALYFLSLERRPLRLVDVAIGLVLVCPEIIPGILASRRGPMAIALGVLFFSYYLTQDRRPSLITLVSASAVGAFILLFLVTFRNEIYLGSNLMSDLTFDGTIDRIIEYSSRSNPSNEMSYSSSVIQNAISQNDFWWGSRYLASLTIWLVPSFIFPNKYVYFGLEGMLYNGGTLGREGFSLALYANGAAPMLIADTFVEFSYLFPLFLFLVGFLLGRQWRYGLKNGGTTLVLYICSLSLMAFLFSQTFPAFAQRLVVVSVPTFILLRLISRRSRPHTLKRVVRSTRSPAS